MASSTVFDFSEQDDWSGWEIENDVVMGGESTSTLERSEAGHALFKGHVTLENDGGFASVQYHFEPRSVEDYSSFVLRLRGDGKRYQFRTKADLDDKATFVRYFETDGDWQTIEIPFDTMKPTYRGRDLDQPNFNADQIQEVRFLIGNDKEQDFALEVDRISLK